MMTAVLDNNDKAVLIGVHENKSIEEIAAEVDISVGSVHNTLLHLEELNLVIPPPEKGQHRARRVSSAGLNYLANSGLIPIEVFRD